MEEGEARATMNPWTISPRLFGPLLFFTLLFLGLVVVGRVPLSYNVRNLLVRWRITLLTALAFTLVVALVTVMLAFVNGMYRLTASSGQPGNVIVMADGATDELFSNLAYRDTSDLERHPNVVVENGAPLASWEVYIVVNQQLANAQPGDRQRRFIQLRGIVDPVRSGKVQGLALHDGGAWFSQAGVQLIESEEGYELAIQAVLGEGIARELGKDLKGPPLQVGDLFEVGPRRWVVVGVMQSAGSTFDSEIWAKRQIAGPMFGKDNYSTV